MVDEDEDEDSQSILGFDGTVTCALHSNIAHTQTVASCYLDGPVIAFELTYI